MGASGSDQGRTPFIEDVPLPSVALPSKFSEYLNLAETDNLCRKNALYSVLDGTSPGLFLYDADSTKCDGCNQVHAQRTGGGGHLDQFDVQHLLPPVQVGRTDASKRDGTSRRTPGGLLFGGGS